MRMYNFIFSNKILIRISRHISFWVVRYIYGVMLFLYNNSNIQNTFWQTLKVRSEKLLFVVPIDIIQCYLIIYWLLPQYFLKRKYFVFSCGVILSSIAAIYFIDLVTLKNFSFLALWSTTASYISRGTPVDCSIFIMIKMIKTWYLKEKEKETLLKENFTAELQFLKAQVHPHFLFNTLNNIYSFIYADALKAKGLVKKLEKILRYMINECEQPFVPLSAEINMINDYLELEKVRYGARLDMHVEISGDYDDKIIAPLLMIPFVENSFKHGTSQVLRQPWIKLSIQADETMLHFTMANSKPSDEVPNEKGIGLGNVKKRLGLLYPEKHYLVIESTVNTFTVNMQIPLEQQNTISKAIHGGTYNS